MKKRFAAVLVAVWLMGCAARELPTIDRSTYTNPEFAFSLTLPGGWGYSDEPPDWVKRQLPYSRARSVIVHLSNTASRGHILISGARFHYAVDTAEKIAEVRSELEKHSKRQQTAAEKNPRKAYYYQLHDAIAGVEPQVMLNELIFTENDRLQLVLHNSSYLYLCRTDESCGLDILLISDARNFDTNFEDYQRLLESLDGLRRQ